MPSTPFFFAIESNPTIGYEWTSLGEPEDPLQRVDSQYVRGADSTGWAHLRFVDLRAQP